MQKKKKQHAHTGLIQLRKKTVKVRRAATAGKSCIKTDFKKCDIQKISGNETYALGMQQM